MCVNCSNTSPVGTFFNSSTYSPFTFVLENASVFVPLTSFTMTSLTGLGTPPAPPEEGESAITRPVTFTCADDVAASNTYNVMYRSRCIVLYFCSRG